MRKALECKIVIFAMKVSPVRCRAPRGNVKGGFCMAVKELSTEDFDSVIASGKTVVDFFATWCGPCKMMAPVLAAASEEYTDIKFGKVDVDKAGELAARYKIMGVPTLIVFKDGEVAQKSVGAISGEELAELLKD